MGKRGSGWIEDVAWGWGDDWLGPESSRRPVISINLFYFSLLLCTKNQIGLDSRKNKRRRHKFNFSPRSLQYRWSYSNALLVLYIVYYKLWQVSCISHIVTCVLFSINCELCLGSVIFSFCIVRYGISLFYCTKEYFIVVLYYSVLYYFIVRYGTLF